MSTHPTGPIARSVLVVDDDADIREVMQTILESEGYVVLLAADGEDALAMLRTGVRPSLILLDMMMPHMNGLEFRAAQLQDPELAALPVVALTGASKAAKQMTAAREEGLHVISKPFTRKTLLTEVARIVP
jgi:CheY-like chemotaxis protein